MGWQDARDYELSKTCGLLLVRIRATVNVILLTTPMKVDLPFETSNGATIRE